MKFIKLLSYSTLCTVSKCILYYNTVHSYVTSSASHTVKSTSSPTLPVQYIIHYIELRSSQRCTKTIHHSTVQYSTLQYSKVQYNTVQYSTAQYNTVQYNTIVQYSTVQYNTVQYRTALNQTIHHTHLNTICPYVLII